MPSLYFRRFLCTKAREAGKSPQKSPFICLGQRCIGHRCYLGSHFLFCSFRWPFFFSCNHGNVDPGGHLIDPWLLYSRAYYNRTFPSLGVSWTWPCSILAKPVCVDSVVIVVSSASLCSTSSTSIIVVFLVTSVVLEASRASIYAIIGCLGLSLTVKKELS